MEQTELKQTIQRHVENLFSELADKYDMNYSNAFRQRVCEDLYKHFENADILTDTAAIAENAMPHSIIFHSKSEMIEKINAQLSAFSNKTVASTDVALKLKDDLGFDSLSFVELAQNLEKQIGVPIKDEDIEKLKTVGDIYKFCAEKIGL